MSELKDFVARISEKGIARPNRFRFNISLPAGVAGSARVLSLMAQSITLPGTNVSTQEIVMQTSTLKPAYDKSTSEMDVTFLCGGDMAEKKIFDNWISFIFKKNHTVEYFNNYVADMSVEQLDLNDKVIYKLDIQDAYPTVVLGLSLDRNSNDTTTTFQVTFTVRKASGVDLTAKKDTKKNIPSSTAKTNNTEYKNTVNQNKLLPTDSETTNGGYMNLNINRIVSYDGEYLFQEDLDKLSAIIKADLEKIGLGDITRNEKDRVINFINKL